MEQFTVLITDASGRVESQIETVHKELEKTRAIAQRAKEAATIAQDTAAYGLGKRRSPTTTGAPQVPETKPGSNPYDPWAGQFGGESEDKKTKRRLEAYVKPVPDRPELYSIRLTVLSTDPQEAPLNGSVQFYLHDSFLNDKPAVPVKDNKAELNLTAWGAFTVGAIADAGITRLELDLSKQIQAPEGFRSFNPAG